MNKPAPRAQVAYTDDATNQHLTQINQHVTQATGNPAPVSNIIPPVDQQPLNDLSEYGLGNQVADQDPAKNTTPGHSDITPEIDEVINGLKGRPRSTHAVKFLKEKMKWLSKKTGQSVSLKK